MGNVPESLIAFIVDRYLFRNQFYQTQTTFRNEASTLFVDSPVNENLLSLEGIVDQYIFTKKQNLLLTKQNVMLMQEKHKTQMLLQDLQNILDSFNARSSPLSNPTTIIQNYAGLPSMQNNSNAATIIQNYAVLPSMQNNRNLPGNPMPNSNRNIPVVSTGTDFPMQNTMSVTPTLMDNINLSSPRIRMFHQKRKDTSTIDGQKRKDTSTIDGCKVAKKPRGRPSGINRLLPSSSNKVDSGSSSVTTQSLVGNYALRGSPISTNSVSGTLPISSQCDTRLPLPSHISQPTEICHAAASNGEAIVPGYNLISTNKVMVQPVKQTVYTEDNHVISPIEAQSDQTNKADTNKTSTGTLDKSFLNDIPTSESEKDIDIWENLDFSNIESDDRSKIDFSNFFEVNDSFTKC
ncbi:hypothetical protein LR48_Vigan06g128600 [Vigna angularis]|uniref:LisH domain-containing protein n=1 Tax=Phaseolus angularis TaxID=3914 RepID=A0A0L9UT09_PHAAN|nr:hypothetical protein LR48_Vigan06g128600 [Vigna angularis]